VTDSLSRSINPAGILVVDKPVGPTSMQVCAKIRWLFKQAGAPKRLKVGHGGTLDPLASGVLVVLVGSATRLCDQIMIGQKEYEATIDLSATSATDDAEGPITPVLDFNPPTHAAIDAVLPAFIGDIKQAPPAFSAVHIGGSRAYDLARRGTLDPSLLGPRSVTIDAIRVLDYSPPRLTLHVTSGKGVYIRSLARDLGRSLGTGGYLTALRRTRVGRFIIDQSWSLRNADRPEAVGELLQRLERLERPL
jgi:tRNA pseudouridine55 synthase